MSRPTTQPGVRERLVEETAKAAKRDCAHHVVKAEGEGRWFFGRPGHSEYHFRVVTSPGLILVHGDIGELILEPHGRDALSWFRGTSGVDYPLGKIPSDLLPAFVEFNRDLAEEIAGTHDFDEDGLDEDAVQLMRTELFEAARAADSDMDPSYEWDRVWSGIASDCEWPSATYWSRSTLFRLACLREFGWALGKSEAAASPGGPRA